MKSLHLVVLVHTIRRVHRLPGLACLPSPPGVTKAAFSERTQRNAVMAPGRKRAAPTDASPDRASGASSPPAPRRRRLAGDDGNPANAVAGPSDMQVQAAKGNSALAQLSTRITQAEEQDLSEVTFSLQEARDLRETLASTVSKCAD